MTTQSIKAGLAYFALVFGAGFFLGVLRASFLVPRFGERISELCEMPLMFAVIVIAARVVMKRFVVPIFVAARIGIGLLVATSFAVHGSGHGPCDRGVAVIIEAETSRLR